jgi:hypothetical protein
VYVAMGFVFLLNENITQHFNNSIRIGFGIILLMFGGFRAFGAYQKYMAEKKNDET